MASYSAAVKSVACAMNSEYTTWHGGALYPRVIPVRKDRLRRFRVDKECFVKSIERYNDFAEGEYSLLERQCIEYLFKSFLIEIEEI
jgi:hypothetical protein